MRARLVNFARTFAAVGIVGANAACATIGAGQPAHSDVPVGTGEQEQPSGETVDVEQSGTALMLRGRKLCDVHETREVARTTTSPRENKSPWVDWTMGAGGLALAGAGVATLIDSGNVAGSDQTSRTYNPVGGTGAVALGAGLIALGIAGGTIAIVDVVRASGSDESKARVSLPGRELRHGVACKTPSPIADVELALLLARARGEQDERIPLGKTGSEGVLRVDLERVLPEELGAGPKVYVMREATEVGRVDLAPVYAAREATAYGRLDTEACAAPKRSDACKPLVVFLKQYPTGTHAAGVRQLLEKAHAAIESLEEKEAWEGIDTELCAKPPANGAESAEAACRNITDYVQRSPNGKHVVEAKAALAKGLPALKRLQDAIKERQRQAELAEKRREQQEAEKEKAALRSECNAKCNVMCSRRVNPAMCLSGCIELCLKQGAN